MSEIKTIRLYGVLGARFGRVHRLAVDSPREAVKALSVLYTGFEKFMTEAHLKGMEFAFFKGKRNITIDELDYHTNDEIRIAPVIVGSKRAGFLQTIIGAVVFIAGAVISAYGGGSVGAPMMKMGAAMALGGVVQMLSPQPGGLSSREDADNKPSYAFGNAVNTIAQGNPVPLLYTLDRKEVGGAIISAGIYAEDQT